MTICCHGSCSEEGCSLIRMPGYWRDLGRPETYLAAHQDLIRGETGLFDDPDWPILAWLPQRPPALIHTGARIEDSLVTPGCEVSGHVRRSVIGPGVVVEQGSRVTDSVIFADVTVGKGAVTSWSILDRGTTVGENACVGGRPPRLPPDSEHITLAGRDSHIAPNSTIPPAPASNPVPQPDGSNGQEMARASESDESNWLPSTRNMIGALEGLGGLERLH